jgi:2-dehydro-3-deoxygalactonokinase
MIGLDWGTTSCRAYLLGEGGIVLDQRTGGRGVLVLTRSGDRAAAFEHELARLCGDWLEQNRGIPLVASGMVGSNQGWVEAGYRNLPVDLGSRPEYLTDVATPYGPLFIIPGLFKEGAGPDFPDVIRGEETQLLGALPAEPRVAATESVGRPAVVVLPGTHTKWVRLEGSVVTDFVTSMTGELFGLVMQHSIIARLAEDAPESDLEAFERGLETAFDGEWDISTTLFSARTLVMAGKLEPVAVKDYVSGLMIGAEVERFASRWLGDERENVTICANASLGGRYQRALRLAGVESALAPEDAVAAGLWRTAVALGLAGNTGLISQEES